MFIERRENKIVNEFDSMTDEQIEAWLDEKAEARIKIRERLARDPPRRARGLRLVGGIGERERSGE